MILRFDISRRRQEFRALTATVVCLFAASLLPACTGARGGAPGGDAASMAATSVAAAAAPVARDDRLVPLDGEARRWVDSVLSSLDRRERAAQLVVPWMSGRYVPVASEEWRPLRSWVDAGVGGIITSIGPPVALADKLNRLQRLAAVPLLIATDMERGPGQRLDGGTLLPWGTDLGGGTEFPPVMAIGATGDPDLSYQVGRVTAREARAVGIHLNFAPVADVNNNPANPIINTRSYGGDPEAVSEFVEAHVRGLQEHGMLSTAKHFPGHGDVEGDSHLAPLILRIDAARADAVELVPFRAAVDAGVAAVMTAHIAFPALAGDSTLPATLSPRMLDSLLVDELGFDGLVVTDALNMGAIVERFGPTEAAVLALQAGADILLQPLDPIVLVDGVVAAVESHRISDARLERSVRKVLEAKARVGLHRQRTVDVAGVAEVVGAPEHRELASRIAAGAITLVRDHQRLVPLDTAGRPTVLSITYSDDVNPFAARAFHRVLARRVGALERVSLEGDVPEAILDSVEARAAEADVVLFVADVRVRAGKGSVSVDPAVAERVRRIADRRPLVMVSLGNPYLLRQMPTIGSYMLAWGDDEASQTAAARALAGESPISGRLPIAIPPLHERGEGLRRGVGVDASAGAGSGRGAPRARGAAELGLDPSVLDALDARVRRSIAGGVTPGAAVVVGRSGGPAHLRGYGTIDWAAGSPTVADSTLYDLASLTKVVGTTTAIMLLVDRGRIGIDDPLSLHVPQWPTGGWRDDVTIRRLLTHRAGLPGFVPFWHRRGGALRGADAVIEAIATLEPAYAPGTGEEYSDLGFILLGAAVEGASGQGLAEFLDEEVWTPLGMSDTGFNPSRDFSMERVAPTEVDTIFRDVHVHGVVHDENAYAMGGVAGHAGLFSSARDLARFAHGLLLGRTRGSHPLVADEVLERFTSETAGAERGLGWDLAPGGGRIAAALSPSAFGHTGFTGTSLWVDPARDLFVVLLTNRVNPTRERGGITALRRDVHRLAARAASR